MTVPSSFVCSQTRGFRQNKNPNQWKDQELIMLVFHWNSKEFLKKSSFNRFRGNGGRTIRMTIDRMSLRGNPQWVRTAWNRDVSSGQLARLNTPLARSLALHYSLRLLWSRAVVRSLTGSLLSSWGGRIFLSSFQVRWINVQWGLGKGHENEGEIE